MHQVDKVLECIARPPPSPVAAKILEVVQDEKAGARDLAEVITKDQAFTARLLRIVNSAYHDLPQKVTTASRAVALLGFDSIKSLALTLCTFGSFCQEETDTISMVQLWEHSLGCAVGARRLAAHVGHPLPEEAFVAGLLHDMGKVLFYQYFKEEFIEAVRMAEGKGISLCEAESHLLGTDHARAGEVWARKWNLPAVIQHAVRFHHHPLLLPESAGACVRKTAAMVHIADCFCEVWQIGKGGDRGSVLIEEGVWSLLAVGEGECRKVLKPVAEEVEKTKELFGLTTSVDRADRRPQTADRQYSGSGQPSAVGRHLQDGPALYPSRALDRRLCPQLSEALVSEQVKRPSLNQGDPRNAQASEGLLARHLGKGTETMGQIIRFPARDRERGEAVGETLGKKLNILVVEDHGSLRDIVSIHLRRHGYHIRATESGETALDILAAENIHLVLLDLMLPQMDGFEVLRRLREEKRDAPPYVIVVSARTAEEDRRKVLELGGNEYLPKPFHLLPLLERIQAVESRLLSPHPPKG